ncbi:hypothetical protein DSECCO2_640670 [anaerobic digester metagenome]
MAVHDAQDDLVGLCRGFGPVHDDAVFRTLAFQPLQQFRQLGQGLAFGGFRVVAHAFTLCRVGQYGHALFHQTGKGRLEVGAQLAVGKGLGDVGRKVEVLATH